MGGFILGLSREDTFDGKGAAVRRLLHNQSRQRPEESVGFLLVCRFNLCCYFTV
jgi:hypothetical protein